MGDEGEPCSNGGACLPGYVCNADNVCEKPFPGDAGGADSGSYSGSDTSHPSDASDDVQVADAGEDARLADTGAEDAADTGATPDSGYDTGLLDAGHDTGADSGAPDTGIVVTCGPSPTGMGGDMCEVPAGAFQMGCNTAVDTECYQNYENPYHQVTVPAFRIDKYDVTMSDYAACNTASPSTCTTPSTGGSCNWGVSGRESHPINCVDWNQAKAYCAWAGKRLPTEAEWEKAARGTDGRKYPWGNDSLDCDHAVWNYTTCGNSRTAPVGSKPAGVSPYGAEDMVGNVWEWVEDDWHEGYTSAPSDGSAWVDAPRGSYRVLRGGGWYDNYADALRASARGRNDPTHAYDSLGFRCSRD